MLCYCHDCTVIYTYAVCPCRSVCIVTGSNPHNSHCINLQSAFLYSLVFAGCYCDVIQSTSVNFDWTEEVPLRLVHFYQPRDSQRVQRQHTS